MLNTIRSRLTASFLFLAISPMLLVWLLLGYEGFLRLTNQAAELQDELAQRVASQITGQIALLEHDLLMAEQVQPLAAVSVYRQADILSRLQEGQPAFHELAILNHFGQESVQAHDGQANIRFENMPSRAHLDYFTYPMRTGQNYYGPIRYDAESGDPFMTISIPLRNLEEEISHILVATIRLDFASQLLTEIPAERAEMAYILDDRHRLILHAEPVFLQTYPQLPFGPSAGLTTGLTGAGVMMAYHSFALGDQRMSLVVEQPVSQIIGQVGGFFLTTLLILGLTLAAAIGGSAIANRELVAPLEALTHTAEEIQAGNLTAKAEERGLEEFHVLAQAINRMNERLQSTMTELQESAAVHARALETSMEVGRKLTSILHRETLLIEVVELVQDAFSYYHVHVYLLDQSSQELYMQGGTGQSGQAMLARGHKLAVGEGLVGRAAANNEVVLVPDVSQEPGWLPNELLPDTQTELAVPIVFGDEVIGVLDVQHDQANSLDQQDVTLLVIIANQLAVALRNAELFERVEREANRAAVLNQIGQRIQRAHTIEEVLQVAAQEVGEKIGAKRTVLHLSSRQKEL